MITSLFLTLSLLVTNPCQTITSGAYKQSEDKAGKTTLKECVHVVVCEDGVEFRVSATSVQTFVRVSGEVWMDYGSQKVVQRVEEADGTVVFWKGKTAFFYNKLN
jgi:hypothetical protein